MKNRHGDKKGGRGHTVFRCGRRGDVRLERTEADIAFDNRDTNDDEDEDSDDGNIKVGPEMMTVNISMVLKCVYIHECVYTTIYICIYQFTWINK
jgi:hypothetical protein